MPAFAGIVLSKKSSAGRLPAPPSWNYFFLAAFFFAFFFAFAMLALQVN